MFSARENRCHRFQANIFNKSKCQNCFKTVDSHKLGEADLFQTKPVQVGWLLLAPEDTDFSSPGHRKRKWQRRYFVLYENGLLRYSLDEMAGTLPHGSVNMTKCCEVVDVSSQTGFQNCLRLCFPDRDYYIRTESADSFSISRWQENLIVYPKAAKSNQKKKGKDPAHPPQVSLQNWSFISHMTLLILFSFQPDLLNFKKGWMSRLGEDGKWQKHWFVLTDQTLRFYRDSAAEEAADVDGEINLSTCYDVTDYPAQRNYGFQIHTKDGVFTLCAMTYGIRRNWVQAVMKNIRPTVAPDVTWYNIKASCLPQEAEQRSRIREGRYKTFDWAELSCKQHKEELSNDLSGRQWNLNNECSVPPASSPEEQIIRSASEASKNEYLQKNRLSQGQSLNIMSTVMKSHLSHMAVSSNISPESVSPGSLEVDAGTVRVHCDSPGELLEAKPKTEKQVATYEHGFSIMEDSHQRVIEEMQRQHQREVERLTEERERVLQEETNATIAAIEAMRKAHKAEMDKTQKALQNGAGVDIRQLQAQYNEELETVHRELEVLSEQYSQKCLENTHLTRSIETEREALSTTHRENQELRIHNQELNEFLAAELSLMHSHMNGEVKHSQSSQEKDMYQLEVNLRVKESEIKCLKQKVNSLKLELQALILGMGMLKLDSELGASEIKTKGDFAKLRMVPAGQQNLMKSRSNPDFLKDHATLPQPDRSKSLNDGLTVLERMKLFELSSTQKI
uniref:Si:ch211-23l10.3 n=1 Tax=Cyprinus carpio TaxID=7962 RepID=A0A8C2D3P5_CYPCA